MVTTIDPL